MSLKYKSYLDALKHNLNKKPKLDKNKINIIDPPNDMTVVHNLGDPPKLDKNKISITALPNDTTLINKSIKIKIVDLPNDMTNEILQRLDDNSFINLGSTCKKYYEYLDSRRHEQCSESVSQTLADCMENAIGVLPQYKIGKMECATREDDGYYLVTEQINCTRYNVTHYIKCYFTKFSRDVDILTCYVDDELAFKKIM